MASRHERKMARNARLANWDAIQESARAKRRADAEEAERIALAKKAEAAAAYATWADKNPIASGKIPVVAYVPPTGHGSRWKP